MSERKGLVMVFTGDGKGKTTAALGQALRAVGHGYKVYMIQFMKGRQYGELKAAQSLPGFTLLQSGRDEFVNPRHPEQVDIDLARKALALAYEAASGGEYDLVILDEVNVALDFNLVPLDDVLDLLKKKAPKVNLILTGRNAPAEIIEKADLVSEVKKIKHHYQAGVAASKGVEF